jgi:NADH:ubiquinone oxidoreductase subunit C
MNTDTVLQTAQVLVQAWAKATNTPEPNRLDVTIDAADLLSAVQSLCDARWGYLTAITGLDLGVEAGELELLYHFCSGAAVVTLRVHTPRAEPAVPSIYSIIPSVSFYEREIIEMFGVTIIGTPNTERLFLPDDWPDGVYPLRKDFELRASRALS